jgi:uncharacterized protein (UPF0332 family)
MTIADEDRQIMIKYRAEQANEAIKEVEILLKNDLLKVAVNRIYYGMFYILNALALNHKFKTSKHHQLIGWFNKEFIKDKKIAPKYGDIIRRAFSSRTDSDYGISVKFQKAEVETLYDEMKDFISTVQRYLAK